MNAMTDVKRPIGVWVLSGICVLNGAWMIVSMLVGGSLPNLGIVYTLSAIGTPVLCVAFGIYLFMLRKAAIYLYGASLVLSFIGMLMVPMPLLWAMALIMLPIVGGIFYYVWHLSKKGILK